MDPIPVTRRFSCSKISCWVSYNPCKKPNDLGTISGRKYMRWTCHSIHRHSASFDSSFECYYADFYFYFFFQKTDANAKRERDSTFITTGKFYFFLNFFVIFQILYSAQMWQFVLLSRVWIVSKVHVWLKININTST